MIDRRRENAARAVLVAAHNRYGIRAFRVDPNGPNWDPLHDAEVLGWCWFVDPDRDPSRCAITEGGLREVEPYRQEQPPAVVQYVCPICSSVVPQRDRGDGLPENTGCVTCALKSAEAAERFRERWGDGGSGTMGESAA